MISFMGQILLFENKSFGLIARDLKSHALTFLLPIFLISLIWEFMNEMNFNSVLKRTILALFIMNFYPSVHKEVTETALEFSSDILVRYGGESALVNGFKDLFQESLKKHKSSPFEWDNLFKKWSNSLILEALYLFCALSFTFLKAIYSLVYHLSLIFAPLIALLSILPPLKDLSLGLLKSTLWCLLVPLFVSIVLIAITSFISFDINDEGFLVYGLDGYIQLFCLCLLLLGSAAFARGLLNSEGLLFFADKTSQTMTLASTQLLGNLFNRSSFLQNLKTKELMLKGNIYNQGLNNISQKIKKPVDNFISAQKFKNKKWPY